MSKEESIEETKGSRDPSIKRLDAIIRLLIELNKIRPKDAEEFNEASAARLLKSVDLTPTEIAKILGKKSRTDVTSYLYTKKAIGKATNDKLNTDEKKSSKIPETTNAESNQSTNGGGNV